MLHSQGRPSAGLVPQLLLLLRHEGWTLDFAQRVWRPGAGEPGLCLSAGSDAWAAAFSSLCHPRGDCLSLPAWQETQEQICFSILANRWIWAETHIRCGTERRFRESQTRVIPDTMVYFPH